MSTTDNANEVKAIRTPRTPEEHQHYLTLLMREAKRVILVNNAIINSDRFFKTPEAKFKADFENNILTNLFSNVDREYHNATLGRAEEIK